MTLRPRRDLAAVKGASAPSARIASRRARPRVTALAAINLALFTVLLYVPSLRAPFVYDDFNEIVRNLTIRDLKNGLAILRAYPTRPLTNLSYAIDASWSGANTFGYHLTNLLLHGLNVVLVFALVRLLIRRSRSRNADMTSDGVAALVAALVAASLFAVHPVQTESVAYISGRAELLSAAFFLVAVLCSVRALCAMGIARLSWTVGTVFAFVCAIGSKEVAFVFPVILLACDWLVLGRDVRRKRRLVYIYLPLFAIFLAFAGVRLWRYLTLEQFTTAGLQWRNALLELHVLLRYIRLLFVPISLSIVPAVPPLMSLLDIRIATGTAALLTCIVAAVAMRRSAPLVTFGIIWFLVTLIPSAAIVAVQSGGHLMAEHRLYLPSVGIVVALAAVSDRILLRGTFHGRRVAWAAIVWAAVVALLSGATIARERIWTDPVALWSDAAVKAPDEYMAQYGLADAYRTAKNCTSAIDTYERAKQIRPAASAPYIGIAACLAEQGHGERARRELEDAVARLPQDVSLRVALAVLEARMFGDAARAATLCGTALAMSPGDPDAINCAQRIGQALTARDQKSTVR